MIYLLLFSELNCSELEISGTMKAANTFSTFFISGNLEVLGRL